MPEDSEQSALLQHWIERLGAGDAQARDELIRHACGRLRRLTRKMLRDFPTLRRWQDSDDVFQNAVLRLCRALQEVTPVDRRAFFSLAAVQIRRELIDLARHYYGPEGAGANHASQADGIAIVDKADLTHEPGRLASLTELHERVDALPADERAVFDLLWYQDVPQAAAAAILGISVPTLKRRWLAARRSLHKLLRPE
jgi:RNA polymerase sigma factor (sigma-70 family)